MIDDVKFALQDETGAFLVDYRSGKLRVYKSREQAEKFAARMIDVPEVSVVEARIRRTWAAHA